MAATKSLHRAIWVPSVFCALLGAAQVVANLVTGQGGGTVLLCFLPMCFVYVAMVNLALVRRIEQLEAASGVDHGGRPKAVAPAGPANS